MFGSRIRKLSNVFTITPYGISAPLSRKKTFILDICLVPLTSPPPPIQHFRSNFRRINGMIPCLALEATVPPPFFYVKKIIGEYFLFLAPAG